MGRVQRKLTRLEDGDRQVVTILSTVLSDGLEAVDTACQEALAAGVASADVILNILARQREPDPPANVLTPGALALHAAPVANCARYDTAARGASCNDMS